jgi:signal transduction histidine kinase
MIYFEIKNNLDEVLASNIYLFPKRESFDNDKNKVIRDQKLKSAFVERDGMSIWFVVQDESDLLNSNRIFNKTLDAYLAMSTSFFEYYHSKIQAHSHTLRSIQGKMKQKIDGLASKKDFQGENYSESKEKIKKKIETNLDRAADTICHLNKRITEIDAHIEGFDVLYMGNDRSTVFQQANIKKVLLNIIAPFLAELKSKRVDVNVEIKDEYAEANNIPLDYKLFNLALCNFLDNAVKYSKSGSSISFRFQKNGSSFYIEVIMESIVIDEDEVPLLFTEGYSGKHATHLAGDGIGMSVIKKALKLNNMEMQCLPGRGTDYATNTFKIQKV